MLRRGLALNRWKLAISLAAFAAAVACSREVAAQALPTATQKFQLSAFGGVSGVDTGLNSSHNISILLGANLGFHSFYRWHPSVELRGMIPIDKGGVVGEKNILGGLKLEKPLGRFKPYGDILYGRGELSFVKLYPDPNFYYYYEETTSNVISPGGGVDIDLNNHFALKIDAQFQRYSVPVTTSGHLFAIPATIGLIYRFNFNDRHHTKPERAPAVPKKAPAAPAPPAAPPTAQPQP